MGYMGEGIKGRGAKLCFHDDREADKMIGDRASPKVKRKRFPAFLKLLAPFRWPQM